MKQREKIDVSICMVSLNAKDVLFNCLSSLKKSDPTVSSEVILMDNNSSDETLQMVRENFEEVKITVGFTSTLVAQGSLMAGYLMLVVG